MNRRTFLGLIGLFGCNEEIDMNIAKRDWWSNTTASVETVDFTGITHHVFLGDSIMGGTNATAGNSYRELITTNYATTSDNKAVGARGVWREIYNYHQDAVFTRSVTCTWVSAGLNDLRRSNTTQTKNKMVSSLKSIVKKAFADPAKQVAGGSNSVTRSGTFLGFPADTYGGVYPTGLVPGDVACYNTTANATWTWSFTGNNVFVVFGATYPSIARGDAEIRIDGVLVETITDFDNRWDGVSDGDNNNQRGPDTRFYTGLTNDTHSIEIKSLSTTAVIVDQIGVLADPEDTGVVMVVQIPYVVDYSKVGLDQANDSVIDEGNALREAIANDFKTLGYRIQFCKIMATNGGLYDLANVDPADDVHPLTEGHLQIYNSLIRYIN